MRVLLIEDDISVTQSIELMLQRLNVQISVADMGEHGIDLGRLPDYDIILLDLNLPDMSGYDVLRQLRLAKVSTPVLILSGLDGIQNKVRGLGNGADDYLTKPFHKDELIARMQAIIRRSSDQTEAVLQCGDLTIKPRAQQAEVGGRPVNLTGTEYKILAFLAQRQGSTLTKEMLLNHLYSGMDEPEIKIIDVFICKLRKKLAAASGGRNYIETVWGRGYIAARAACSQIGKLSLRATIASHHPLPRVLSADCRFSGCYCPCGASPLTPICGTISTCRNENAPTEASYYRLQACQGAQGGGLTGSRI